MAKSHVNETQFDILHIVAELLQSVIVVLWVSRVGISRKSRWRAVHLWKDILNFLILETLYRWIRIWVFALWNFDFVCSNKSSCLKAVDSNQFLIKIKFGDSSRWSCRCRSRCLFCWSKTFTPAELRTPSNSLSGWNGSQVKTLSVFVTTFSERPMPLGSSCLTELEVDCISS